MLATLGGLGAGLAISTLEGQPQAIERASRSTQAGTEVRPRETKSHQRWLVPSVQVVIDESVHRITPDAEQAVIQAFGAWLSIGPNLPELSFENGSGFKPKLDPDGVNAVMYAPIEFAGHEDDLAITIGFSDEETGEITEADIIINSRHIYANLPADTAGAPANSCDGSTRAQACEHRYDLQNVMTHEVGHFYGLGEDREDRSATMYSCTSACETHKRDLSAGDRRSIDALYQDGGEQRANLAGCSFGPIVPQGEFWMLAALGMGLSWVRRRCSAN